MFSRWLFFIATFLLALPSVSRSMNTSPSFLNNLFLAIQKHHVATIYLAIQQGHIRPTTINNIKNEKGDSLSICALRAGDIRILHLLILAGAQLHTTDKGFKEALLQNALAGNIHLFKYLIHNKLLSSEYLNNEHFLGKSLFENVLDTYREHRDDFSQRYNSLDRFERTANQATLKALEALLDLLLTLPLTLPLQNREHAQLLLIMSITSNNKEKVETILASGLSPHFIHASQQTPLMIAASQGNIPIIKLLIEHGANIQEISAHGTLLHYLARCGEVLDIVPILVDSFKNDTKALETFLLIEDERGNTAFHIASSCNLPFLKALLSYVSPSTLITRNQKGMTCISIAAGQLPSNGPHNECFESLLERYPALFTRKILFSPHEEPVTSLHQATTSGSLTRIKRIINLLEEPDQTPEDATAFYQKVLLQKDNFKRTPLSLAAYCGHLEVLEYFWQLLRLDTYTPQELSSIISFRVLKNATQRGHLPIVEFLINHGALSFYAEDKCMLVLHALLRKAIRSGNVDLASLFLQKGAPLVLQNSALQNQLPLLHLAVLSNNVEMVNWLLPLGDFVEEIDSKGSTAIDYAVKCLNVPMIRAIHSFGGQLRPTHLNIAYSNIGIDLQARAHVETTIYLLLEAGLSLVDPTVDPLIRKKIQIYLLSNQYLGQPVCFSILLEDETNTLAQMRATFTSKSTFFQDQEHLHYALQLACGRGHLKIVESLLAYYKEKLKETKGTCTLKKYFPHYIRLAARKNYKELLAYFLKASKDFNVSYEEQAQLYTCALAAALEHFNVEELEEVFSSAFQEGTFDPKGIENILQRAALLGDATTINFIRIWSVHDKAQKHIQSPQWQNDVLNAFHNALYNKFAHVLEAILALGNLTVDQITHALTWIMNDPSFDIASSNCIRAILKYDYRKHCYSQSYSGINCASLGESLRKALLRDNACGLIALRYTLLQLLAHHQQALLAYDILKRSSLPDNEAPLNTLPEDVAVSIASHIHPNSRLATDISGLLDSATQGSIDIDIFHSTLKKALQESDTPTLSLLYTFILENQQALTEYVQSEAFSAALRKGFNAALKAGKASMLLLIMKLKMFTPAQLTAALDFAIEQLLTDSGWRFIGVIETILAHDRQRYALAQEGIALQERLIRIRALLEQNDLERRTRTLYTQVVELLNEYSTYRQQSIHTQTNVLPTAERQLNTHF